MECSAHWWAGYRRTTPSRSSSFLSAESARLKGLGADRVVDYTTRDFRPDDREYDFVLDAVGPEHTRPMREAAETGRGSMPRRTWAPLGQNGICHSFHASSAARESPFPSRATTGAQIIDAAARLVVRRGLDATGTAELVAAARVSHGSPERPAIASFQELVRKSCVSRFTIAAGHVRTRSRAHRPLSVRRVPPARR